MSSCIKFCLTTNSMPRVRPNMSSNSSARLHACSLGVGERTSSSLRLSGFKTRCSGGSIASIAASPETIRFVRRAKSTTAAEAAPSFSNTIFREESSQLRTAAATSF